MDGTLVGRIPSDHESQVLSTNLAQNKCVGIKSIPVQRHEANTVLPTSNKGNWDIQNAAPVSSAG